MANGICALVPATAMAAIAPPVRSRIGLPTQGQPISPFSSSFIFDGAADPADLRRFAASVSGSSYWVLWLGARLRPHYMAAVRPSKNVQPIGWRTAKLAYRDCAVFAAGVR